MTEANKKDDLTANSMTANGKISFTINIPKQGWCNSVQPCSEQCELYKWMKAIDFQTYNIPVSMAEQKDSVNVNIMPTDINCRLENPGEPGKGWTHLDEDINNRIVNAQNFIWCDVRRCCLECRHKNQGR